MADTPPVIHMIGQGHLDPVWLWPWTEGRAEALATCYAALNCLKQYPDFHFTRGEALVYRWIEAEAPEMWAEIKQFMAQGRWHVVNGMVIQPDMNLPSGESFVRQALLGKRYLQQKLGVDVTVAYCVDSFGHAGTLPQILRKCGFDSYVFMRPMPREKDLPAETFWWQGPDGSRILAFRIAGPYQTGRRVDLEAHIEQAVQAKPAGLNHTMSFFGVGNHGGGPTRAQIEHLQQLARRRQDISIRFSHPQAYFEAIRPEAGSLPVVADELQMHAIGCYSVNSLLKRLHRQAECGLLLAERLACMAHMWAGRPLPLARLETLWWDILFNQFHDTLGGSSIKRGEDEAIMALGRVALGAQELADEAGRAIAHEVDTGEPGGLVLFNPFPQPVEQYVEYEPWTQWEAWDEGGWGLADEAGRPVPHQVLEPDAAINSGMGAVNRVLFPVQVPPLGYRLYRVAPGLPRPEITNRLRVDPGRLENDRWQLRLDPQTGAITSCLDRASGLDLVGPAGWNLAQVLQDDSDTWSHDLSGYDRVIGRFTVSSIRVGETGPLQASLFIERVYEGSTWLQQLVLRQGEPAIILRNWLNWQGQWRLLKLAFHLPLDAPRAYHDVPFGWLERPVLGQEVPTQMWLDVTGSLPANPARLAGLALLNDGKYSCDVRDNVLRLTVLRCPPYAYHQPHQIGTKRRYDWVDQGQQEFTLVLLPHLGDWRDTDMVQRARALNLPLVPVTSHAHPGRRPAADSLMRLEAPELEMTALKPAEDGQGFVVRLADRHGRGGAGRLVWQGRAFDIALSPFEAGTWRLWPANGEWQLTPCDMIERVLGSQDVAA